MDRGLPDIHEKVGGEDTKLGRSLLDITLGVVRESVKGIAEYLEFTFETAEDYDDKWLPTLDTSLRVSSNNTIEYKYYEKPTTTNTTIRMESAMCENSKLQCLSNDLVRRLLNTRVELSPRFREGVIDQYGTKLMTSGFGREQAKKILVNGIKGYVSKMRRRQAGGRKRIHNTADESRGSRMKKKLVGKSSWYRPKQKNEDDVEVMKSRPKGGRRPKKPVRETQMRTRAV